jgi:N-acetylglutamate synthase-like GNAT family acetyltransferase
MIVGLSNSTDDARRIIDILVSHNNLHSPATTREPFCLVVRDECTAVVGGAIGWTAHRWCYVDVLALTPETRGSGAGAQLLAAVENLARSRDCIGVYLFSYSFQAPGFYERHGFTAFGELTDLPPGHTQIWLSKRI